MTTPSEIAAALVLPAPDLSVALAFFTERGFRLHRITGADDPDVAELEGHGLRLRFDRSSDAPAGVVRLEHDGDARREVAPNGTILDWVTADRSPLPPPVILPRPVTVEVSHLVGQGAWGVGRAGMRYRELVSSRLGGSLIASHIGIPDGGPVPDYVHHHHVRFQMIYCARGWVRVVYEDQGEAFVMEPGDCVLQPPHIRHRVLEASPGLEVFELASPATHDTFVDHELTLPTAQLRPDRDYLGQRFVRHVASEARRQPLGETGLVVRDTGIGDATGGLAHVRVIEAHEAAEAPVELELLDGPAVAIVTEGAVTVAAGGDIHRLERGSCAVLPGDSPASWAGWAIGTALLVVTMPPQHAA